MKVWTISFITLLFLSTIVSANSQTFNQSNVNYVPLNPNQIQPRNYSDVPKYEPHAIDNSTQQTKIEIKDSKFCVQFCIAKNILIIIGIIFALIIVGILVWLIKKIFWI